MKIFSYRDYFVPSSEGFGQIAVIEGCEPDAFGSVKKWDKGQGFRFFMKDEWASTEKEAQIAIAKQFEKRNKKLQKMTDELVKLQNQFINSLL